MPYVGMAVDGEPYFCPNHRQWYAKQRTPDGATYSCTVAHSPGSCCHFGEYQVDKPSRSGPRTSFPVITK